MKRIDALLTLTLLLGLIPSCLGDTEPGTTLPTTIPTLSSDELAKPAEMPWEKGSVTFGGFLTAFDSTVAIGGNNVGLEINAEDLLNLDSKLTVFRVNALYRPGQSRRNQLDFTYAAYHRSGHATLDREITIGDSTLPVGAELDTVFNFDIIRGDYSYAVLQDDRMRVALGLGIYAVPLYFSLKAETTSGRENIEAADTTLPLPSLTVRSDFLLIRKLYLNIGIEAMYLEINDFKGSLLEVNLALEYRPWKYFGVGLGYSGFSVDVEGQADSSYPGVNFVGEVGVHYGGLMLYGKLLF
jgi:hypothetical protein